MDEAYPKKRKLIVNPEQYKLKNKEKLDDSE